MITQERLKQCLSYNPETGDFVWLIDKGSRGKAGAVTGCPNGHGYLEIIIDWQRYKAHRLAFLYMTGSMPEHDTDHINGIRADNRWSNLRRVTRAVNLRNKSIQSNNKSVFNGVYWSESSGKWCAQLTINRKRISLGSYSDKAKAIAARLKGNKAYGFHENHGRVSLTTP